jgi:hypothetical protein
MSGQAERPRFQRILSASRILPVLAVTVPFALWSSARAQEKPEKGPPTLVGEILQGDPHAKKPGSWKPDKDCKLGSRVPQTVTGLHVEGNASGPYVGTFKQDGQTLLVGETNGNFLGKFVISGSSGMVAGRQKGYEHKTYSCDLGGLTPKPVASLNATFITHYTAKLPHNNTCVGGDAEISISLGGDGFANSSGWSFKEEIKTSETRSPKDCADLK